MTPRTTSRSLRVWGLVVACGLAGIVAFVVLASRAITVQNASRTEAASRIASIRAGLPSRAPLVDIDDNGHVVRTTSSSEGAAHPVARLKALAWRDADQRLVSADTPFWFFKLKGPAARFALEGTGFDLDRLGLTPADIGRFGPGIIVDHGGRDGNLLLVWAE